MNISTLSVSECALGESPLWHATRQSFLWVDVSAGILYELRQVTHVVQKWEIGTSVSLVLEAADDKLILAIKGGVVSFDLQTGKQTRLVSLDDDISNNRCNDGALDCAGRL